MRTIALVRVAIVAIGLQEAPSPAAAQGPFCFSNLPFTDQFSLSFDSAGGSSFAGYGQNLLTGAPASSYGFVAGGSVTITITSSVPATGEGHTFFLTAQLNLATGQGPGRCEAVNTRSGCGPGSAITLALVACPAGAAASSSVEMVEPPLPLDPAGPAAAPSSAQVHGMAYGARPGGHTDQSGRTHDSERMRPALRPDRAVRARGVSRRLGLEAAGGEEPERGRARAG